jgi:glutamate-5-semialdehyde dehydrogenase
MTLTQELQETKQAAQKLMRLSTGTKNKILRTFAQLLHDNQEALLGANAQDLAEQSGHITDVLYQRLKLDAAKLNQLATGIEDVARLEDPVGKMLDTTLLDDGLILEKVSVPLGVLAIIFESRPDVLPQIVSLALKSGNAVLLKGGREALHSNRAMMTVLEKLSSEFPELPTGWVRLLETREVVHELLAYPQYIDLVIPRGSNALVQSIMKSTQIPVLGHADGICHIYVHPSYIAQPEGLQKAIDIILDAKTQYPSACNTLETLLVDQHISQSFLPVFDEAAKRLNLALKGCLESQKTCPHWALATEEDWRTEYGDLTLSIKIVSSEKEAIDHINHYGSHHTDCILAWDDDVISQFQTSVDSAGVFVNCSTRFADGFRFGFGAEVGISTAKTHARGPVGLEGLVIYQYRLTGSGQCVKDYVGENAKPFLHQKPDSAKT